PYEPHAHAPAATCWHREFVMGRRFGPGLLRVHSGRVARDEILVERVLEVARRVGPPVMPTNVGVILREQPSRTALTEEAVFSEFGVLSRDYAVACRRQFRTSSVLLP